MKKFTMCFFWMLVLIFSSALSVTACWVAPEPFEVYSDDESRVFVFVPYRKDGRSPSGAVADASVYEIINNERHLVYTVENLSDFSFSTSFLFSTDMNHFIRRFPSSGMYAFEVFSYGIRTRVVMRYDFIEDYDGIQSLTSVGPIYTVNWRIEDDLYQNSIIKISTSEGNTFHFDLATAEFILGSFYGDESRQTHEAFGVQNKSGFVLELNRWEMNLIHLY